MKIAENKVVSSLMLLACGEKTPSETISIDQEVSYNPEWESLYKHNVAPEWFRDAKFGIYFHWGVYKDIRFTQTKDGKTLYAIVLGWPQEAINLETLKVNNVTDDAQIQLLGSTDKVTCTVNDDTTLTIQPPKLGTDKLISKYAVVFKLTGFDLDIHH